MIPLKHLQILSLLLFLFSCKNEQKVKIKNVNREEFPGAMVEFIPYKSNPVLKVQALIRGINKSGNGDTFYTKTVFIKCGTPGIKEKIPLPNI